MMTDALIQVGRPDTYAHARAMSDDSILLCSLYHTRLYVPVTQTTLFCWQSVLWASHVLIF